MKKRIALILTMIAAFVLVLTGCSNKSANSDTKTDGTLTIGLEGTYAPYSYRDNGKLKGFEVDLGKAIAKKLDLKAKFVPTKWDSLIAGLNSNTFDVVLNNVAKNPSREKHYIFSTPYIYSKSVIITKDGTGINSVNDIKGKKISAGTGTDNYNHAEKFGAKVVPAADFQTDMSMINQGRVAGAFNSKEAFLYWKESHKNTDLKYITIPNSKLEPSEIAPIYNKKSTHLRNRVNKAIKELYKDGTMKKLSNKYFGEDITKK
ncbi:amino acid ABC transporter substrate-binding component [Companilactobacillus paralimentarius DSM 13238 = JCM 10415]|jgi:ABC-type amino acid transport/signal transduction systems, periplasmic component/domain|uniref:Amino acid ABC transporter substrate-binding component n=1 Tax=Companilactobacillus paralimentarius DSM 13238 = JCM 10415 TaxID=1122151 RepID=A0A0R1PHX9_9LACO|nr:transporter substrate-binding domain-containing protein [Companilactobacillus paralimentarius]KAE9562375.1 amino acid ABC transporter substrate-binding protein [Companilactobacillus paralimentarius]KRL31774.1 amino acid ABC transporter substrate-binding component [Companilactobacillus paralimentarius DSM 13238 = JCM 10415]MDR4934677.1 transporter substrate-binding domain-containing protein [Companilactobacillus paralimentarius]QFR68815.1 transporter substrate-binding domain-containing protei